jgi:FRG domain
VKTAVRSSSRETPLSDWFEFEERIPRLDGMPKGKEVGHPTLFRGLADSSWGLETTLERSHPAERCGDTPSLRAYYRKIFAAKSAVETLSGRRWRNLPAPPDFDRLLQDHWSGWLDIILSEQVPIYEYLVYLRHHGFPSPLLDWTASPYVAAFFAFDVVPADTERVSVYAMLQKAGGGSSDEHCFVVGPHMRTHPRHFRQQCWYSMCVAHDQASHDFVFRPQQPAMARGFGHVKELLKFTIPSKDRGTALRQLDLMNINAFSLFGSEDSLIRTIARRECYFKKW